MQTDQVLGGQDAETIVDVVRTVAARVLELDLSQYCVWVRPDDPVGHRRAAEAHQTSDCGLMGLAMMRALGCAHHIAWDAHRPGMAPYPFERIRRAAGEAWRGSDTDPELGDIVVIGADGNREAMQDYGHPGHCLIVIGHVGDDIISLDGGTGLPRQSRRPIHWQRGLRIGQRRIWGLCRTTALDMSLPWEMP